MKHPLLPALALSLTLPLTPLTMAQESAPAATPVKSKLAAVAEFVNATVTAVDQETREVVLTDEQGRRHAFIAGEQVRNLGQVEVGDTVSIKHLERMAVNVYPVKTGAKGRIVKTEMSRSDPGQKPHGTITQNIELTGVISAIDPEARVVTIEGKYGDVQLPVSEAVDISTIEVGGTVRAEYVETLSITVSSPRPVDQ